MKGNIQHFSIPNAFHLVSIIDFVKEFGSYKFDTPTLEQQQLQVIAMTPIEAGNPIQNQANKQFLFSGKKKRNYKVSLHNYIFHSEKQQFLTELHYSY
jgi:hypothetical protein